MSTTQNPQTKPTTPAASSVTDSAQPAVGFVRSCRAEHTGVRPTSFSRWHRERLPSWAWACDLDLLEVRSGRGVVLVGEIAEVEGSLSIGRVRAIATCKPLQLRAVRQIAEALGTRGVFVLHTAGMDSFGVLDLIAGGIQLMGADEFRAFLEAV